MEYADGIIEERSVAESGHRHNDSRSSICCVHIENLLDLLRHQVAQNMAKDTELYVVTNIVFFSCIKNMATFVIRLFKCRRDIPQSLTPFTYLELLIIKYYFIPNL